MHHPTGFYPQRGFSYVEDKSSLCTDILVAARDRLLCSDRHPVAARRDLVYGGVTEEVAVVASLQGFT